MRARRWCFVLSNLLCCRAPVDFPSQQQRCGTAARRWRGAHGPLPKSARPVLLLSALDLEEPHAAPWDHHIQYLLCMEYLPTYTSYSI